MDSRFRESRLPTTARTMNLLDIRHRTFATDLVFVLASECRVDWHPPGQRNYAIRAASPLTPAMRDAVGILTRNCRHDYDRKFDQLLHPEGGERFEGFFKYAGTELSALMNGERHMFRNILYIARLSLVFHRRGFPDAPDVAALLIAQTMSELNDWTEGSIYSIFSQYADGVIGGQG